MQNLLFYGQIYFKIKVGIDESKKMNKKMVRLLKWSKFIDMPGKGDPVPVELLATEVGQPILAFISALFTAALVNSRITIFPEYSKIVKPKLPKTNTDLWPFSYIRNSNFQDCMAYY